MNFEIARSSRDGSVELRDIQIFLALAEELHFGRTAERLRVSQARVSQSIKQQERRTGGALFERTSRSVRLNPLGERLRDRLDAGYREIMAGRGSCRGGPRAGRFPQPGHVRHASPGDRCRAAPVPAAASAVRVAHSGGSADRPDRGAAFRPGRRHGALVAGARAGPRRGAGASPSGWCRPSRPIIRRPSGTRSRWRFSATIRTGPSRTIPGRPTPRPGDRSGPASP